MSEQTNMTEFGRVPPTHLYDLPKRSVWQSVSRGLASKCPNCGEGDVFEKTLTVAPSCANCGEELHHHRADDFPAYLNIFVVGHIVVGLMMGALALDLMGMWTLMAVTCIAAIVLSILMMRPLKGAVVGAQWALHMHGFGGNED